MTSLPLSRNSALPPCPARHRGGDYIEGWSDGAAAVAAERDLYRLGLEEIAKRPTTELNPDGVDQAAWSMQLIAQEVLAADPGKVMP